MNTAALGVGACKHDGDRYCSVDRVCTCGSAPAPLRAPWACWARLPPARPLTALTPTAQRACHVRICIMCRARLGAEARRACGPAAAKTTAQRSGLRRVSRRLSAFGARIGTASRLWPGWDLHSISIPAAASPLFAAALHPMHAVPKHYRYPAILPHSTNSCVLSSAPPGPAYDTATV